MQHVVMFSGGIGSWMTAKRVIERHGVDSVTLLFADVQGRHVDESHIGEDEDAYRFIDDAVAELGAEFVVVKDGRSIWEVYRDDRFLGNTRLANCSKFLKQIPCRTWLDANRDPETTVCHVGIDWSEEHRLPAIRKAYLPYRAEAPLTEPPHLSKTDMIEAAKAAGLEPPRLYAAGYPHNNCGGFCVRAGQAQFRLLLQENRDRYLFHENEEQKLRDYLGSDVAILRDRRAHSVDEYNALVRELHQENNEAGPPAPQAKLVPLTLRSFRERMESGDPQLDIFAEFDFGGCGCFTETEGEAGE